MTMETACNKVENVGVQGEQSTKPAHGTTTITLAIFSLLDYALRLCRMVTVVGRSGLSKSDSARLFASHHHRCQYFEIGLPVRAIGSFLQTIAREVGAGYDRSNADTFKYLCERLRPDWYQLLIFDEAHFLSWEAFECLRQLHDRTGIGMAFLGQERLYAEMKRRGSGYCWDQISGRMGAVKIFSGTVSKDDVRIVAASYCQELSEKAIDFLHKKAQMDGAFRKVKFILEAANEVARLNGVPVDFTLIAETCKGLGF